MNALAGWPGLASLSVSTLFAATVFLNAGLLIAVQPMIGKMLLPLLGGAPAVWNTSLVFFQTTLLLGYGYAHLATTRLDSRVQVRCHLALVALGLALLPLGVDARPFGSFTAVDHPVIWVLLRLAVAVGLPFLALSAGAPALQVWFSRVPHLRGRDPYVLYAASNAGSLIALLSYPMLVEPQLSLRRQAELWTVGYAGLLLLLVACALSTGPLRPITGWLRPTRWWPPTVAGKTESPPDDQPIGPLRRLRWAALSFVPSSALLGVTAFLTADVGAVPSLWVVPLALYLASFVLAFGPRPAVPSRALARLLPAMVLLVVLVDVSRMTLPLLLLLSLHLATFFVVALICHGKLARDRPSPARLTEYYLVIAAAGALGGVGNALIAPVLFASVAEYPFILVVACALVPWTWRRDVRSPRGRALDVALPLVVGALTAALVWTAPLLGLEDDRARVAWMFAVPAIVCYTLVDRPLRFALGLTGVLVAGQLYTGSEGRSIHRERTFFGVVRVTEDASRRFVQLVHGGTVHGRQRRGGPVPAEPLSYYHPTGPAGEIVERFREGAASRSFAVVGLGVGALCAYARDGDEWVFYEIDDAIERIARNPRYFTFWTECRAARREIVRGDARLRLTESADRRYGMLVLDAFSADAIPLHLVTREALALYDRKTAPGGWIVFHISSRTLDLRPMLARLAEDAGWVAYLAEDLMISPEQRTLGKDPSVWVVMARRHADVASLGGHPRWQRLRASPDLPVWTDDFSSLWSAIRWW